MIANIRPRSRHFPAINIPAIYRTLKNVAGIFVAGIFVAGILRNRDPCFRLGDLDVLPEPTVDLNLASHLFLIRVY